MTSEPFVPASCIRDAVAVVAADGALQACNASMEQWVEQHGSALDDLPLAAADRCDLEAGDVVQSLFGGEDFGTLLLQPGHIRLTVETPSIVLGKSSKDRLRIRQGSVTFQQFYFDWLDDSRRHYVHLLDDHWGRRLQI